MLEITDFNLQVSCLDTLTVLVTTSEYANMGVSSISNANLTREGQSVRMTTQSYRRHTMTKNEVRRMIDYGEVESLNSVC